MKIEPSQPLDLDVDFTISGVFFRRVGVKIDANCAKPPATTLGHFVVNLLFLDGKLYC